MNLLQLRARLRRSVKNPDDGDVPDTDLTEYINDGYRDLASRYAYHQTRKRCTFVTVSGRAKYQLPPDCASVLRLRDTTNGRKLRKMGDRLIADARVPTFESFPLRYVRYRNYVELSPVPDGEYIIEVYYIAISAELTLDTDEPVLPVTWHNGIWMRAKWYYYMDRGDIAQQTQALNNYTVWLSDKPSEIEEETVDIDNAVELPELERSSSGVSGRYDDGLFDFRS